MELQSHRGCIFKINIKSLLPQIFLFLVRTRCVPLVKFAMISCFLGRKFFTDEWMKILIEWPLKVKVHYVTHHPNLYCQEIPAGNKKCPNSNEKESWRLKYDSLSNMREHPASEKIYACFYDSGKQHNFLLLFWVTCLWDPETVNVFIENQRGSAAPTYT